MRNRAAPRRRSCWLCVAAPCLLQAAPCGVDHQGGLREVVFCGYCTQRYVRIVYEGGSVHHETWSPSHLTLPLPRPFGEGT